jgi:hypothetical protein
MKVRRRIRHGAAPAKVNWRRLAQDRAEQLEAKRLTIAANDVEIDTMRAGLRQVAELHAQGHARLMTALRDLLAFFDRQALSSWTPADGIRLGEIRQIASGK